MTPEAQRIAIVTACGWKVAAVHVGKQIPAHLLAWERGTKCVMTGELPDYLADLNAMHEAISTLPSDGSWTRFLSELENVTNLAGQPATTYNFLMVNATAAQRAEALLRTLGKWEDSA